jgi:hypothetical protein
LSSEEETALRGSGEKFASTSPFPLTEIFNKQFPYYLSIGMTYEQYWEDDCLLVKFYREAEKLRTDRMNQQAWLQGMYVYDAMSRLSPLFRAFAKKGTKAQPYVEEPYPINSKAVKDAEEKKEKGSFEKGKAYMAAYMASFNKAKKGSDENANND